MHVLEPRYIKNFGVDDYPLHMKCRSILHSLYESINLPNRHPCYAEGRVMNTISPEETDTDLSDFFSRDLLELLCGHRENGGVG